MGKKRDLYLFLVALHIGVGFGVFAWRPLAQLYFLASLGYFLMLIFKNGNKNNEALFAAAYIAGGEVFFRMTGAAFAHEVGKYGVICFLLIGLFFSGTSRKSGIYWLYILLLIPGVIYAALNFGYELDFRRAILFSISGPLCLGIAALYCIDRRISLKELQYVCWSLLMPVISMGVYLYFFTPDTRDVLSGTGSNFATSGGFGPNQVATALGLGMFLLFVQLFVQRNKSLIFFVNLGLLSLLSYRAFVTFSRGGVLTAVVVSALFLIFYYRLVNVKVKKRTSVIMAVIVIVGALTWGLTSIRTEGLIDKRYANKDAAGRIKEDASTGRVVLINSELEAFKENPLTGVGVGKVREYRTEKTGIVAASHNELSRLLSEHGLAGVIALLILLIYPLFFRIRNRRNYLFFSFLGFWFLTINHSSMRIAAPALIYALSLLNVVYEEKNPVHRKRLIK